MRLAVAVAAGLALAAPAAAHAAKNPCALVTAADVKAVLGVTPSSPTPQTLGLFQSCTYNAFRKMVTIQTRRIDKTTFVKSTNANPGGAKAVAGLGVPAFSVGGGSTLVVWKNGTAVTLLVVGTASALASEKVLAKKALARL